MGRVSPKQERRATGDQRSTAWKARPRMGRVSPKQVVHAAFEGGLSEDAGGLLEAGGQAPLAPKR